MSSFDPRVRQHSETAATAIALYRIAQAIMRLLRRKGQALGLSPTQVQALLFLAYGRPGARTVSGLAQRLGCTLATASGVATALEEKGLIAREPASRGRTVFLRLTPQGEEVVRALDDVLADLEDLIADLPPDHRRALHTVTRHLVYGLAARGHVVPYEMCWECTFFRPFAHPDNPHAPHHCAFMDAPLPEEDTYTECPDFVPKEEVRL